MSEVVTKELPDNWAWATFGDVADLLRGVSYSKGDASSEPVKGKVPVLRANNIGYGLNFDGLVYVPENKVKEEQYIRKGDIIIAMSSGSKHLVGKAAQANDDYNGAYGAFCANLRVTTDVNPKYVAYYYSSQENLKRISASSKGSNINNLKREHILGAPIPVAPPEQQKRIVAKIEELFSHIDAGIEALKKAKQLLKQYRQSVLKAAVTGELTKEWREANKAKLEPASDVHGSTNAAVAGREGAAQLLERILKERRQKWVEQQLEQFKAKGKMPKDDKWKENYPVPCIADELSLPNEWITASLDQLAEYITSGSRGWAKYYAKSGATFIRAQNLKYDYLELDNIAYVDLPDKAEGMRTRVKYGDLLVTITGANVTKTGYVNIELDEAYVSQHVALCRPTITECARYVYTYLISQDGARKNLEEAAYGAGKPGLNLDNLKTLQIALPSIDEQEEIVRLIEQRYSSVQRLEDELRIQLKKADKNKQSVLASAFSGGFV